MLGQKKLNPEMTAKDAEKICVDYVKNKLTNNGKFQKK